MISSKLYLSNKMGNSYFRVKNWHLGIQQIGRTGKITFWLVLIDSCNEWRAWQLSWVATGAVFQVLSHVIGQWGKMGIKVELHKEHEDDDLMILKLERNEVLPNVGKLNSLMPSSPMPIPPFLQHCSKQTRTHMNFWSLLPSKGLIFH